MLLYIIRHGDPDYETDSLTERGALQAEAVGKRLAAAKIDRVFTSPLGRAKQTAEPACRLLGLTPTVEDWTEEISEYIRIYNPDGSFHSVSGLQNTTFLENGNIDISFTDAVTCEGINKTRMNEVLPYLKKEGDAFLERLGYKYEDGVYKIVKPSEERVALFCHAAFTRAWLSILLHIPVHIMWASFSYDHTGVTVLEFKNNENGITAPQCLTYSDISHLYAHGPDTDYCYTASRKIKI
ncbi:MAG: histidine phosphatase family protein [Clostridia bacterium]|nr:histidine phosphatase family protein [Clostridia bacterium]